jgi:hypothetical protein
LAQRNFTASKSTCSVTNNPQTPPTVTIAIGFAPKFESRPARIASESISILTWDLTSFLKQLEKLHDKLKGAATFDTLEGQIKLELKGDGRGQISLVGQISNPHPHASTLTFQFGFDQTYLAESITQLRCVVVQFPAR